MTDLKIITDHSEGFRAFITAYRSFEPTVLISSETEQAIDQIIEAISASAPALTLLQAASLRAAKKGPGARCSKLVLKYLRVMRKKMERQGVDSVSPLRATEILYNFDELYHVDDAPSDGQPFLLMMSDLPAGCWSVPRGALVPASSPAILVSTKEFSRKLGGVVWLRLHEPREYFDWSLNDPKPPSGRWGLRNVWHYRTEFRGLSPHDIVDETNVKALLALTDTAYWPVD